MDQTSYDFRERSPWVEKVSKLPFPLGTFYFLLTSPVARDVFRRVVIDKSTDTALHPIYEYTPEGSQYTEWDHRWQSSYAAQSLRFRFQWIQSQIRTHLQELQKTIQPVNVISLGAGTGYAFINVMKDLPNRDRVKIHLVDQDKGAGERAQAEITKLQLDPYFEIIEGLSSTILDRYENDYFHLVELVGIAEYINDNQLIQETKIINQKLHPNGYYIGAAISSNIEADFAHKVLHWPSMQYRTEEELTQIFNQGGPTKIQYQTCGIFKGWIAQK